MASHGDFYVRLTYLNAATWNERHFVDVLPRGNFPSQAFLVELKLYTNRSSPRFGEYIDGYRDDFFFHVNCEKTKHENFRLDDNLWNLIGQYQKRLGLIYRMLIILYLGYRWRKMFPHFFNIDYGVALSRFLKNDYIFSSVIYDENVLAEMVNMLRFMCWVFEFL